MKTRHILAIICGALSILFFFIGIFNVTHAKAEIEPFMCQLLFECSPEDFSAKEVNIHDETSKFCTFSYVNKDGNLVLILSRKQINAWVYSLERDINAIDNDYNVDISSDYQNIIINGYSETLTEDVDKAAECYAKLWVYCGYTDRIDANYIVLKDGVSGEVLYKLNMKDTRENYAHNSKEFDRILAEYDFGSISEKNDLS